MLRLMLATLIAVLIVPAAQAQRAFTAHDLAMLDRVSDPRVAADGRQVAYNLRSTDWEGNRGLNALHIVPATGGDPVVVVEKEKAPTNPRWGGDGRLYFLSGRSGTQQVWRRDEDGALVQVTAFPLDVIAFRLSADARALVAAIDADPDCPTLACSKAKGDAKAKTVATGQMLDPDGQIRFWDSYSDDRNVGLFHVALSGAGAPAEATPLTRGWRADIIERPDGDDGAFAVTPDGRTVWFASSASGAARGDAPPSQLWSVTTGGGAPRALPMPAGTSLARPTLSPDGRRLAYLSRPAGFSYARTALMVRELGSGRTREVAPGLDMALGRIAWSADGRSILTAAESKGQVPLIAIDVADGRVRTMVADGQVTDFDGPAYVRASLTEPGQLYMRADGSPQALTRIGAAVLAAAPMAAAEQFSFAGWNDETVYGWMIKPAGWKPGRKYPVAFIIHGGPHGTSNNSWSYRWNPQVWAGMGYAVVQIDFHGSSGYGEAFGRSIINHWGDRPLEDLQKGWTAALKRYDWLDGSRACALGASYGGYMINWIAGQWQGPWKCLVNHAGLFDTRSMSFATDIPAFSETQYGGLTTQGALAFNPADHAAKWKTPMLVIHGARDYRVPLDQGISTHLAMRRAGAATQFLLFPDENHWVLKPQNSVQWYATVEAWMKRWLGPTTP